MRRRRFAASSPFALAVRYSSRNPRHSFSPVLLGSFGELDRPYFFCTVYLARLDVSGSVRFMLDTGADTTMLGNADAKRLGIGSERTGPSRLLHGLGGSAIVHDERALLVFSGDNGTQYAHDIDLAILDPEGDPTPSLLPCEGQAPRAPRLRARSQRLRQLAVGLQPARTALGSRGRSMRSILNRAVAFEHRRNLIEMGMPN